MVVGDAELSEHLRTGLDHHGWTAEIVLGGFSVRVFAKVFFEQDFVDETLMTSPAIFRKGRRQSQVKAEVGMRCRELFEIVLVEDLLPGAGTVPEAYSARCLLGLQQVGQMGT